MKKIKLINHIIVNLFIFLTICSFTEITAHAETEFEKMQLNAVDAAGNQGLFPSVMMGQLMLESGLKVDDNGNFTNMSALGSPPNHNLFGIKGEYQGQSVIMNTREEGAGGGSYWIDAKFRKYPSWKESLEDNAALLKSKTGKNPRVPDPLKGNTTHLYSCTWREFADKYEDATLCLTNTYATDSNYSNAVNGVIKYYEFDKLDGKTPNANSGKDKKEDNSKYVGEDAWKNRMINFQVNTYENTFKGIETGSTGFISNAFILNANKTSIKAMEWAYIIMFTGSIVLFFFMFSATIFYLVILPNGLGGMKVANFYEKTTGISATVNKQTTIDIICRLGITTFLVACIYANLIPMFISSLIRIFSFIVSLF